MRIPHIQLLFVLTLALLCSSCRSHRYSAKDPGSARPELARFEQTVQNNFAYEALQSKVKYQMGSTSLSGKLCLESGQRLCLQVNAPLIGFEIARVEASQEQVLLVDKYDKLFSVLQLSGLYQLEEISGHEMEALECLMLGRIFIPGKGQAERSDFARLSWSTEQLPDGSLGLSQGLYEGKGFTLLYSINEYGRLLSTRLTVGAKSAIWQYAGYHELAKSRFVPGQETITATNESQDSFTATLTLNNPELGESTWRDFEPSSSYRQVTAEELLEIIKKLGK